MGASGVPLGVGAGAPGREAGFILCHGRPDCQRPFSEPPLPRCQRFRRAFLASSRVTLCAGVSTWLTFASCSANWTDLVLRALAQFVALV